jgi:hypothetical protein
MNMPKKMKISASPSAAFAIAAAAVSSMLCVSAHAAELSTLQNLTQSEFRGLSEDLGAGFSYKGIIPAEPLGVTGFDIGAAVSSVSLEHRDVWAKAGSDVGKHAPIPSLRAHKGLPFGIDLGVMYSQVPKTGINLWGGEVRWSPLQGSTALPAVAFRLGATKLSGLDQLDLNTTSFDVSVSKGFLMFTPYAGVGTVHTNSKTNVAALKSESFSQAKVFAGVNVNFALLNVALEMDRTGGIPSTSLKLGLRF